jgi:hypothetical protein
LKVAFAVPVSGSATDALPTLRPGKVFNVRIAPRVTPP